MKKPLLIALTVLSAALSPAQIQRSPNATGSNGLPEHRNCGTQIPDPAFEQWMSAKVQEYKDNVNAGRSSEIVSYTIPMIIHIINAGTAVGSGANITLAQAQSEVAALNADYAATNPDISGVPAAFTSLEAGNTGVQFCLAKVSPTGTVLAEVGVERISYVARGWTDPNTFTDANTLQSYFDNTIKPATIWDPTKYLNVWVAQMDNSQLLGYASFPAGTGLTGLTGVETATTSGVVINEKAWGTIGTAAAPYNKGRTATHEIGHWLGLRHIWGDGSCLTDYCNDTPPQQGNNFGCPTYPLIAVNTANQWFGPRCNTSDPSSMFMDYMDYVDDGCMFMFSADQRTRIQTTMANGTYRVGLNTSGKCNTPYALDASISAIISPAAGSSSCSNTVTPVVTLTNSGSTTLTSVTIKYSYDGGTVSNYAWTGSLTSGSSATVTLPTSAALTVATHTITVATNAPNGSTDANTANDSKSNTFSVITSATGVAIPFTENFEATTFPPTGWSIVNPDAGVVAWGTAGAKTWVRRPAAGNTGSTAGCAALNFYYYNTDTTQTDDLVLKTISLVGATSPKMTFKRAYHYYPNPGYFDGLRVSVSSDCGTTFTSLYYKNGITLATNGWDTLAFTPTTAANWDVDTVNLASYIGQNVIIKFTGYNKYGNNLYIDDVNVSNIATSTVASVAITSSDADNIICAGTSVTFTAAPTNGGTAPTYQWKINGTNVTGATAATFTTTTLTTGQVVTCVMTSNLSGVTGSPATSNSITMTVNAVPATPTVTTNSPVCAGSTINLSTTAVTGATYAWTGPATYTSAVQNPTRPTSTTAMAGTYSLTITKSGCTSAAGTAAVVVNAVPATPTVTTNSPVCSGSTINLSTTAVTGATYAWTGPATYTSAVQNPTRPTSTTAMAGTYSLTVTKGGCTSAAGTATVVVNATPATPTVTTNSPVCAGSTINLSTTAVTGATYAWTGPATFTSAVQNPTRATATAAMAGTYSLTVSASGCTSAAGTATVVVNAKPATPTASSNTPVCAGSSINLSTTAVTGATYAWTGPSSFTNATQNPVRSAAIAAMAGTYSVTVTTNGCTSAAGTTTVVVNATPATPTATATSPVCTGATIALSTTAVTGATYAWTGPGTYTNATRNPSRTAATTAMAGTYSVTITSGGCTSAAGTATVVVNTTPATPTASSNSPACSGTALTLSAPAVTGATYAWTGPGSFTSTTQNPTMASATTAMAGTYSVTVTANGCTSTTGTTAVIVHASPTALATTTAPSGCSVANGSIVIGSATGGTSPFTYSVNSGVYSSSTSYPGMASGAYTVIVKDANGCSFSTTATVGSSSGPTALSTTPANSTCGNANGSVAIGATTGGAVPYTYSFNAGTYSATTSYTGLTAGTYTVIVKDAGGCTFTVNPVVTDVAGPSAQSATAGNSTCGGTDGTIDIGTTTGGTPTYMYSVDGSAYTATTSYSGFAAGTYNVSVQDANGCSFTTTTTVGNTGTVPVTPTITQVGTTLTSDAATGNQWYVDGVIIPGATAQSYTYTANGTYTVEVTTGSCTSAAATGVVVVNTGIVDANNSNSLSVYPNPNDGNFTVSFSSTEKESFIVELTNSLGQVVFKEEVKDFTGKYNKQLNVEQYGKGIYMLNLTNSNHETVKKIVVY